MENTYKKKVKVSYTLPEHIVQTLKAVTEKRGLNQSVLVQLALEKFFREEVKDIDE